MCQEDCSGVDQTPLPVPTLPSPSSGPVVTRRNDEGLYVISIPSAMDETVSDAGNETGSGGTLMSGTGSGDGREAYLVRVTGHENETFFSMVSVCT